MNLVFTNNHKTYYDMDGVEYEEGDIVKNTFFGDLWVVRYSELEDETDCEYQLVLYDDRDLYSMDIDQPEQFRIISKRKDTEYKQILKEVHRIRRNRRKEDRQHKKWYRVLKALLKLLICLIAMSLFVLSSISNITPLKIHSPVAILYFSGNVVSNLLIDACISIPITEFLGPVIPKSVIYPVPFGNICSSAV